MIIQKMKYVKDRLAGIALRYCLFTALLCIWVSTIRVSASGLFPGGNHFRTIQTDTTIHHYEYVLPDNKVYVYDIDNAHHLIDSFTVPTSSGVRGVAVSPVDGMMYISYGGDGGSNGNGSMLQYNLVAKTLGWNKHYSHGIDSHAITPDGKTIYMPDGELASDGRWYVVNASDGTETGTIINTSTPGPHNTTVSPDGTLFFMGGRHLNGSGPNNFYVGSTATNQIIKTIGPTISGVRPFTVNGSNTFAFITCTSFLGFEVCDLTTGTIVDTLDLTKMGFPKTTCGSNCATAPSHGISLSPDETEIYVVDSPNNYIHVFDVSGIKNHIRPVKTFDIQLQHPLTGSESNCAYDCPRDGWVQHSLDGKYVYVGDAGDVISTATHAIVAYLPALYNTRKSIEVDWQNGHPIATSSRQGMGYVGSNTPPFAPVLSLPSDGATNQPTTVTLNWNISSGATFYRLQLSPDSLFNTTLVDDSTLSANSRQVSSLTGLTKYFWRVNARSFYGTSPWSSPWEFTTTGTVPPSPLPSSPDSGAFNQLTAVTLHWSAVASADSYRVQLSSDSSFIVLQIDSIKSSTSMITGLLSPSTKYFWRVNAKNSQGTGNWSDRWWFVTRSQAVQYNLSFSQGWNLLSVPVVVSDSSKAAIFPNAGSDAFAFYGRYLSKDTLINGIGYWVKFGMDTTVVITGSTTSSISVDVRQGWNLVGSISTSIPVTALISNPGGIVTSQLFGYSNFYQAADSIRPGQAYWIKMSQPGRLTLSSSAFLSSANAIRVIPDGELPPSPPVQNSSNRIDAPKEYALDQAFPNPFNPTTTIGYKLPYDSRVSLQIYNALGQLVSILVDGVQGAGIKSVEWNAGSVATGVYLYRFEATSITDASKTFVQVRKMALIK